MNLAESRRDPSKIPLLGINRDTQNNYEAMMNMPPSRSDDWWLALFNRVYLWSGALAAFFGVVAIVATRGIQVFSARVDSAQKKHIAEMELQTAKAYQQSNSAENAAAEAQLKIAEANARMAEARENAARAIEGQQRLELETERARLAQKDLEAQVAKSKVQQAELEKNNLELRTRLGQEESARAKLEPRRISGSQRTAIVSILRSAGIHQITMDAFMSSSEALQFAESLKQVIQSAGWKVDGVNQAAFQKPVVGLWIAVKDAALVPQAAEILARAFATASVPAKGVLDGDVQPGEVKLVVGAKP